MAIFLIDLEYRMKLENHALVARGIVQKIENQKPKAEKQRSMGSVEC